MYLWFSGLWHRVFWYTPVFNSSAVGRCGSQLAPSHRVVRPWLTSEGGTLKTTSAEGSGVEDLCLENIKGNPYNCDSGLRHIWMTAVLRKPIQVCNWAWFFPVIGFLMMCVRVQNLRIIIITITITIIIAKLLCNFVVGVRECFYLLFTFLFVWHPGNRKVWGTCEVRVCNVETKQLFQTVLFQTYTSTGIVRPRSHVPVFDPLACSDYRRTK
jgi:hypothetical protein